ncbi:hypothetical protein GNI_166650 [Gregarina niphandrodes]|uniref:Uncharacterized protein n=1 Tax=Gregarina niphandrodes TaxID=110365 RepID=A0A023AY36_GRENI|nr:hypothetical protein GNI_166650 [Gregarina niphandrodes]EZG43564.1 hypothetical protein GNI_166650 [Gregarina niphandrodes]|eukprot:XP_011133208.1 hypothetical protein GNI_166650 [Gregarina niphandrodes]
MSVIDDCTARIVEIGVPGENPLCGVVLVPCNELWKLDRPDGQLTDDGLEDSCSDLLSLGPVSIQYSSSGRTAHAGEARFEGAAPFDVVRDASGLRIIRSSKKPSVKYVESVILSAIERYIEETHAREMNPQVMDELCVAVFGRTRANLIAAELEVRKPTVVLSRAPTEEDLPELLPSLPESWQPVVRASVCPKEPVQDAVVSRDPVIRRRWCSEKACAWATGLSLTATVILMYVGWEIVNRRGDTSGVITRNETSGVITGNETIGVIAGNETRNSEIVKTAIQSMGGSINLTGLTFGSNTKKLPVEASELALLRVADEMKCTEMWKNQTSKMPCKEWGVLRCTDNSLPKNETWFPGPMIQCYDYGMYLKQNADEIMDGLKRLTKWDDCEHVCTSEKERLDLFRRNVVRQFPPGSAFYNDEDLRFKEHDNLLNFTPNPKCMLSCKPNQCQDESFGKKTRTCNCGFATATCVIEHNKTQSHINFADFAIRPFHLLQRAINETDGNLTGGDLAGDNHSLIQCDITCKDFQSRKRL